MEKNNFLVALIITDVGFIFLHFLYLIGRLTAPSYSIMEDMGYSEIFMYVKEFWVFLFLVILSINTKKISYLVWSFLFIFFLIDDSLRVHERFGNFLATKFNFPSVFGLKPHDLGELAVIGTVGFFIFSLIGLSYLKSEGFERLIAKNLIVLIVVLVFFGVFVDIIHSTVPSFKNVLGILEEGGELVMMSLILSYVFSIDLLNSHKNAKY